MDFATQIAGKFGSDQDMFDEEFVPDMSSVEDAAIAVLRESGEQIERHLKWWYMFRPGYSTLREFIKVTKDLKWCGRKLVLLRIVVR